MTPEFLIELYGYLGSVLVVVSMLMASVVKLRVINVIGSVVSGTYALIIGSFPLALMNGCLIIINLYNLFKLLKTKQQYDMVSGSCGDATVQYFLSRYQEDIRHYFPGFDQADEADAVYMVFCEGTPAGVLLGKKQGDAVDVMLDYSVPAYRDCSVGAYLYSRLGGQGVKKLVFSQSQSEAHAAYLIKMGFTEKQGVYTKKLG